MSIDLSLYKIADAMQMALKYQNGKVSGEQCMTWETMGQKLPFTLKAEKLFAGEQVGVLFHVMGDLYIIVSHFPKTGTVSIYMVDGSKTKINGVKCAPEKLISKKMILKEVVESMGPALVKAHYWKQGEWKPLALPK